MINATPITIDQIFKSYNGKSGCMCGCNGSYTLPSHTSIDEANARIGYDGYDSTKVSDRRVKIAINKINAALDKYRHWTDEQLDELRSEQHIDVGQTDRHAWITNNKRTTVVFFK